MTSSHGQTPTTRFVLDTNAYRYMAKRRTSDPSHVNSVRTEERRRGFASVASPVVGMELVSRLGRGCDATHHAEIAISAMLDHCLGDDGNPQWIADPDTTICHIVLGRGPSGNVLSIHQLGHLMTLVRQSGFSSLGASELDLCFRVKKHVEDAEEFFLDRILDGVLRAASPAVRGWEDLERRPDLHDEVRRYLSSAEGSLIHGRAMVQKACELLGERLSPERQEERAKFLVELYPAPIALFNEVLRRALVEGCRLNKRNRANWYWDINILYSVASRVTDDGLLYRVVTQDGDMLAAAAGTRSGVAISYIDYGSQLGFDWARDLRPG